MQIKKSQKELWDEGYYEVLVNWVKDLSPVKNRAGTGEFDRILVSFRSDDLRELSQAVLAVTWGDGLLVQLCQAVFGEIPQEFESDDFVGHRVIIEVAHNVNGQTTFNNVISAWSIDAWELEESETTDTAACEEEF